MENKEEEESAKRKEKRKYKTEYEEEKKKTQSFTFIVTYRNAHGSTLDRTHAHVRIGAHPPSMSSIWEFLVGFS